VGPESAGGKRFELCSGVGSYQSCASSGRSLQQHGRSCARDRSPRQSLCKSALERLELAEKRIETVERERREAINKLRDASKALEEAQSRIIAVEDRLTAAEFRAQAAETDAREAKQALALVEEAIRSRLLSASPKAGPSLGTVV
jgi:chromosome segregation ATPase